MKIKTLYLKITLLPVVAFIIFFFSVLTIGLINIVRQGELSFIRGLFDLSLYISLGIALTITLSVYKILVLIDKELSFTKDALKYISRIKRLSILMTIVLLAAIPLFYRTSMDVGSTIVFIIGLAIIVTPAVIALFIATIEKLLYSIIQIKSENDLTV
ncbi:MULTISPECIES: DUF2975 domain-containing protein [Lactococcus]|uniref:DUF2975 domain-containing protein n=1 Tax=Lactococcus TaxID=1357 RepID=UPI0018A96151|nr:MULTISPECIES: DUF2975 domain-containing protein [Lactococcus]MDC0825925.1 DUF2975 domain-containing protein [Lactococcus petauri]